MSIVFLDLETTGTDPLKHTVTEIYAEYHDNGLVISEFHVKVKQPPHESNYVSLGALKVTATTLSSTWLEGDGEMEAVAKFVDWLLGLGQKRLNLCGHNINFDINFLKILFSRCRVEGWDEMFSYRVEDTAILATTLQKCELLPEGSLSLENLSKTLKINLPDNSKFHSAQTDTKVTAAVYYTLVGKLNQLGLSRNGENTPE